MKVYILDKFHPAGVELMKQHADVVLWDDPDAVGWHRDADAIMVRMWPLTADDFDKATRLKVVAKQGVGVNTIDLDAARRRGVTVCNTPGVNSEAVAEMAMALTLAVSRRVADFAARIRAGEVVERADALGLELWGRTVGVVGMGNIGTRVARKWRGAFETPLLAYDPFAPRDAWADIPHERVGDLSTLLKRADVVTLHLPLTAQTRHLIGAAELAVMKPQAVLVNVSRGGIVDEDALYEILKAGRLFGAGLDVFEVEPPTLANRLVSLPNVVATPHAAGSTEETQARSSQLVAEQLLDVMAGKEPLSRVA
ncbi:hydroxyacid dehydrogenase [Chelatococcus sp. GCM10030263]|uniref:hydroxyacid dehydrogenase n=1 Tax=Chelatococcus sp. GCM10030263 TaxID=3273387 RepID=UPI003623EAA6